MENKKKVAIIGSGPAGLTAAIYTSRANLETTIYSGVQPGGQLTTTTEIENFPGFPDGIMGPDLMTSMQRQAERFGAKVEYASVQGIKISPKSDKPPKFEILYGGGQADFDAVIVASGASAKYLGLPDEEKYVGKGYHTCATCDGFFYRGKTIAVVGGGDSAMEEANFLTKFADKVYLIHRSQNLRASKIMRGRVEKNPKIEFLLNKEIKNLIGQDTLNGVDIQDTVTGEVSNLPLDGVFVAIGHTPNTNFAADFLSRDELGYLLNQTHISPENRNSKYSTSSNIEGIFVGGDVEDKVYRQAITAAGDGCKAAMDLEKWLEEQN
jgi:thioredoxin reductase (NADPH)